jgi:pyruvate dehydrogenase E2 component (dihydrolipoamide acetyltransferase)
MAARDPITMPKLGLTMQEGVLSSWLVKPGSIVKAGDVIFVVETDKIANEVEASEDGVIGEIAVAEGETVSVGTVLATWAGGAGALSSTQPEALPTITPESSERLTSLQPQHPSGARLIATPLARRLARQAGLDLHAVTGSGSRGRIMAADVLGARVPTAVTRAAETVSTEMPVAAPVVRPVSQFRKVTAERLTLSKQTIPHFYVMAEADITSLDRLRGELNAMDGAQRISVNHFIVHAVGRALVSMPDCNAVWVDDGIQSLAQPDVGIAVEVAAGVLAPVLRNAGGMTLDGMVAAATRLVAAARDGKLKSGELSGGAVTVSNVGMYGASYLVPIINPGQTMILGVGAAKQAFRPDKDGNPALRNELGLVLSCDHRVIDGVAAAKFLTKIKHYLESPLALLRIAS